MGDAAAVDPSFRRRVVRGFYEHARVSVATMSAAEWEELTRADPHAAVVGERTIEAISAMVWQWDR